MISITAVYLFANLIDRAREKLSAQIEQLGASVGLRGLIIISPEGVNGTVAGSELAVCNFKSLLTNFFTPTSLNFKDSQAQSMPFRRFKVDLRGEVVTSFRSDLDPLSNSGTYLSPEEWEQQCRSGDAVVLDTRNVYETEIGMFQGAIDPQIRKFSEFNEFAAKTQIPKDKKILMYCTGGIRCEKALPIMKSAGFNEVYQLHGGILRYLAERPDSLFQGECFVFDHRVALDQALRPSKRYRLCPHCGNPAAEKINCRQCRQPAVVCVHCLEHAAKHTCSKNCAYHARSAEL